MNQHNHDLAELVRKKGHRLTAQRQLILEAVHASGKHITPDEVYEYVQQFSTAINRTTVYRTLEFLCDIGLITSTTAHNGHLVYETTAIEPHHHLICQSCGKHLSIPHELIMPLLTEIGERYEFQVVATLHLSLFGVCAVCQRGDSSSK